MIDKNLEKYDRQAPRQVSKKISRYHHKDKHPDKYQRASKETAMMTNIKEHLDDF